LRCLRASINQENTNIDIKKNNELRKTKPIREKSISRLKYYRNWIGLNTWGESGQTKEGGGFVMDVMMTQKCKIVEAIKQTNHYGKHVTKMDDYENREQVDALMEVASYLEPIWKSGAINFLQGKTMGSIFFQPSTRTRLGSMVSMIKLGGQVIADATPLVTSRLSMGATLEDEIETWSQYIDIISMRHPNAKDALEGVEKGARVPVLSGGFGGYEHPVAGYTDMFTTLMELGRLDNLNVLILGANHTESRVAHSYAHGMAKYPNNKIVLVTEEDAPNPPAVIEELKKKADCEQVLSPTKDQVFELMRQADICNLSGLVNCVPSEPEAKKAYLERVGENSAYYISVEMMDKLKKEKNETLGLMHPFPRYPHIEMDHALDRTEFALWWKQMDYAQPARMAMILSMIYATEISAE
jgi:aspartate carbamoyltransferase catalytic subunit